MNGLGIVVPLRKSSQNSQRQCSLSKHYARSVGFELNALRVAGNVVFLRLTLANCFFHSASE